MVDEGLKVVSQRRLAVMKKMMMQAWNRIALENINSHSGIYSSSSINGQQKNDWCRIQRVIIPLKKGTTLANEHFYD